MALASEREASQRAAVPPAVMEHPNMSSVREGVPAQLYLQLLP